MSKNTDTIIFFESIMPNALFEITTRMAETAASAIDCMMEQTLAGHKVPQGVSQAK